MKALHDNESSFGESSTYDPPPAPPPYLSPAGTIMERGNPFHVDIPALRDDESSFGESSPYDPPPAQTSPDSAAVPPNKLGRSSGTTTCTTCQKDVKTEVTYKVGAFAILMSVIFALLGCLLPFFIPLLIRQFRDVHHTCPLCKCVLHVKKIL